MGQKVGIDFFKDEYVVRHVPLVTSTCSELVFPHQVNYQVSEPLGFSGNLAQ